jgi:hypothetical protein
LLLSRLFAIAKSIDAYKKVRKSLNLRFDCLERHRTRIQDFVAIHFVVLVNDCVVAILCRTRDSTRLCRQFVYFDFSLVRERRKRFERHKQLKHLKILKRFKILVRLRSQAIVRAFLFREHVATISNARDIQFDEMNVELAFV